MCVSFASQVFRFGRRTSSLLLKMQLWDYKLNLLRFPSADVVSSKSFLRFHKQLRIRLLSAALEQSFVRRNSSSRFQWPDLPRGRVFLGFRSWIVYLSNEKGKLFRWNAQLTWKENKKKKNRKSSDSIVYFHAKEWNSNLRRFVLKIKSISIAIRKEKSWHKLFLDFCLNFSAQIYHFLVDTNFAKTFFFCSSSSSFFSSRHCCLE